MKVEMRGIEIEEVWVASLNEFNDVIHVEEYGEKGIKFESRKVGIGFVESSIWYR